VTPGPDASLGAPFATGCMAHRLEVACSFWPSLIPSVKTLGFAHRGAEGRTATHRGAEARTAQATAVLHRSVL